MLDRTISVSVRSLVRAGVLAACLLILCIGGLSAFAQQTGGSGGLGITPPINYLTPQASGNSSTSEATPTASTYTGAQPTTSTFPAAQPTVDTSTSGPAVPSTAPGVSTYAAPQPSPAPASCNSPTPTSNSFWSPGPSADASTNTYEGAIDRPTDGAIVGTSFDVSGWAVDSTANGWAGFDDVQLYSGQMGAGGTLVAKGIVGGARPDVATSLGNPYWANSAFYVMVPASANLSGTVPLNLYVHTPSKGWWVHQFTVTVSAAVNPMPAASPVGTTASAPQAKIESPSSSQIVHQNQQITVTGYAFDPAARNGNGVDTVKVSISAQPSQPNASQNTGPSTVTVLGTVTPGQSDAAAAAMGPQFQNAGWSVPFSPNNFVQGQATLTVEAHSSVTNQTTTTTEQITIQP